MIDKGHRSLSIKGGNSLKFASNRLMSLSGLGHSMIPYLLGANHQEKLHQKIIKNPRKLLAFILYNNSGGRPMQASGITLVLRSVSPSKAEVCIHYHPTISNKYIFPFKRK